MTGVADRLNVDSRKRCSPASTCGRSTREKWQFPTTRFRSIRTIVSSIEYRDLLEFIVVIIVSRNIPDGLDLP
jgi:hypothetical protein